jgi:segregation and condensation protein B
MSLKAKLEAVIYAAEEPVTLSQLSALFAADALEWKAEQEAASAEQAQDAGEPLPPLAGEWEFDSLELSQTSVDADISEPVTPQPIGEPVEQSSTAPGLEASPETGSEPEPALLDEAMADDEREARRLARLRDREVNLVIRQLLDELIASYASDSRGVEIREIAGGYRMATKPECHDAVRSFVTSLKPPLKLSLPALETLAVVAYKQPVTAPEVNEIRGVESVGVLGTLLARKLIATAGRKLVIGRPILYRTTREFLLRFGLKDVSELPSMEEFEKLAAIELEEPEFAAPGEAARAKSPDLSLELDETLSEDPAYETNTSAAPENQA